MKPEGLYNTSIGNYSLGSPTYRHSVYTTARYAPSYCAHFHSFHCAPLLTFTISPLKVHLQICII